MCFLFRILFLKCYLVTDEYEKSKEQYALLKGKFWSEENRGIPYDNGVSPHFSIYSTFTLTLFLFICMQLKIKHMLRRDVFFL